MNQQNLIDKLIALPGNDYMLDLFCGAGGTTTGAHAAGVKVFACVNHDQLAIESHTANHPYCIHFVEDIRHVSMSTLKELVDYIRQHDGNARIHIWASLECTHHSGARGGKPRNADSRTLGNDLFPYLDWLDPDALWIENVREWMSWGPLDERGKPVSRLKGSDYVRWVNRIREYGYSYDFKLLNSANYGAYTKRTRFFAQCVKPGLRFAWPHPTHAEKGVGVKKWKAVREVLDFSQTGNSIFGRKKPLRPKTMARIYAGLVKFVQAFIMDSQYNNQPAGIDEPSRTITASRHYHYLVNPQYASAGGSVDTPCFTLIARMDKAPPHMVTVEEGEQAYIIIYPEDCEHTRKIKMFMAAYGIIDIKMRMLFVRELLQIQGFSPDYKLMGRQEYQKKFVGNSVEVNTARALLQNWVDQNPIQQQRVA